MDFLDLTAELTDVLPVAWIEFNMHSVYCKKNIVRLHSCRHANQFYLAISVFFAKASRILGQTLINLGTIGRAK